MYLKHLAARPEIHNWIAFCSFTDRLGLFAPWTLSKWLFLSKQLEHCSEKEMIVHEFIYPFPNSPLPAWDFTSGYDFQHWRYSYSRFPIIISSFLFFSFTLFPIFDSIHILFLFLLLWFVYLRVLFFLLTSFILASSCQYIYIYKIFCPNAFYRNIRTYHFSLI